MKATTDRFRDLRVGSLIGVIDGEVRVHRAGVGERHAGLEAQFRGCGVQRGQAERAFDLRNDYARFTRSGRAATFDPIGRQMDEPDCEIAAGLRICAHGIAIRRAIGRTGQSGF